MGLEAEQIFKTFSLKSEDDENDYEIVMEKFDEYFIPKEHNLWEYISTERTKSLGKQ